MNEHPHESLPAFAIGALDPDETLQVSAHLATCATCRDEAERFHTVVETLPYVAPPRRPPDRIKRQLFARIAVVTRGHLASRNVPRSYWAGLAATLIFGLALAILFVDARANVGALTAQIAHTRSAMEFMADPQTIAHQIDATERAPGAQGRVYMQPGDNRFVLVAQGLDPSPRAKRYRCWLVAANERIPVGALIVDNNGAGELMADAPAALDRYTQLLVTMESATDDPHVSEQVVLMGSLHS